MTFNCPACDSKKISLLYDIKSFIKKIPLGLTRNNRQNTKVYRCNKCGLGVSEGILSQKNFNELYTKDKIYTETNYEFKDKKYQKYTNEIQKIIDIHCQTKGNLLEIGFLDCHLLNNFKNQGWNVEGLELDASAVENAKAKNIKAHNLDLCDPSFTGKNYSLIYAIALFEHIEDPNKFIKTCHSKLKKGGKLILQFPNHRSLNRYVSSLSKHKWDMYSEPGHVYHYDKTTATKILQKNHFKTLKVYTSTILIRGKVPILPTRFNFLEELIRSIIFKNKILRLTYNKLISIIDYFKLGDTLIIVAQK